jgi:beta-mannosidase
MTTVSRTSITAWTITGSGRAVPAEITGQAIPATVPGAVHTDLMAAGLIPDPYLDENEKTQSWIGLADWTYRTTLHWTGDGSERQELLFEGIDTIAQISLNGSAIATTRNMHRSYRIDVTDTLIVGDNVLEVAISSPIKAADAASLELGYRPHTNHHPYNAIRKMACSFGWDWGIDTSTSALWRPVTLETWSGDRLTEVRVAGDVVDGTPRLRVNAAIDGDQGGLELLVTVAGVETRVPVSGGAAAADMDVDGAELWWPRGYGTATLHDASIVLLRDGAPVDERRHRVGFRSVEIRTPADGGFAIIVNGTTVHIRGANWIPDDAFLHRIDRPRYARRLAQAEFANINLIRVWGGGIYESDDFYTECDERGILAWQDFLLACAAYAEDEPLWSEFEAEAREAITRIATHPSLVVFNGGNENLWGFQDWDWDKRLDGRTWGAGYYYDLFPSLVAELAPHVGYTPGSPFTPDRDAPQNNPDRGTAHIWDLWNVKDWPHYRDSRPRFVSEFGWQGPPTWSTLVRSVTDDPMTPESPGMLVHQKAIKGNDKLTDGLTAHFPLPNNMDDWHWAMSLNQAIAVRTAIEWWRSLTPHCTGTIMWQLNDCWPVTSWAAVDGDERPKPLLYALRQAHADRLLTIQPDGDGLRVAVVNDSKDAWTGTLRIERRSFDGLLLQDESHEICAPSGSAFNVTVCETVAHSTEPRSEVVIARLGDKVAHWFFVDYRDSALEPAQVDVDARPRTGGWDVHVTARVLLREVTLLTDRIAPDASADAALLTMMPGETTVIRVEGAVDSDTRGFAGRRILRSANDLVSESSRGPSNTLSVE